MNVIPYIYIHIYIDSIHTCMFIHMYRQCRCVICNIIWVHATLSTGLRCQQTQMILVHDIHTLFFQLHSTAFSPADTKCYISYKGRHIICIYIYIYECIV